ncbi:GNAT family N-acetyltransferase [Blautia sp. MSJ-19]|uniref:GNAT family N-acetyltransferase n=1 Tax=Blautia sp. MSJ-19 TaxID=2841517 RepID=UPI001C0EF01A|nr:GNAT family N-acetyltransferase [Blautia sp. MSJ-19]MBU5480236.1 GNAT family N-acetyltransferase [Blautia sp. MSJ-19]
MSYIFQKATADDVRKIFPLYEERLKWMDEGGIRQWNTTDYLEVYPLAYYEEKQSRDRLFILTEKGTEEIVAAAVLLDEDARWPSDTGSSAFYIHNLVTACHTRGAGKRMIEELEQFAVSCGKNYMRLDCTDDSEFLNQYYEGLGYEPVGYCVDDLYRGIRREKKL